MSIRVFVPPSGAGGTLSVTGTGSAGTPAPGVVSVQGTPGMTPVTTTTSFAVTPTVDVGNFPATQTVAGTVTADQGGSWTVAVSNLPATQTVAGTVTADQGGSWTVAVSNLPATQTVAGSVSITNFPATQPVSFAGGQNVAASAETSTVYSGATAITPQFAVVNVTAAGSTSIVAPVTGKTIRVLQAVLIAAATTTVTWQSSTGPTAISGPMALSANGGYSAPFSPVGLFETASGSGLDINLSVAAGVGGHIVYIAV